VGKPGKSEALGKRRGIDAEIFASLNVLLLATPQKQNLLPTNSEAYFVTQARFLVAKTLFPGLSTFGKHS
jgi:hypothetical protein